MTYRVGIGFGPGTRGLASATEIREFARIADRLGFAHFWVNDHISWREPIMDPFILLSHLAAVTNQIGLATGVYLLPLRSPVVAARSLVSLDYLSGGRAILGVGVGGEFAEDYNAVGVPLEGRGRRADTNLGVLKRLLVEEEVTSRDEYNDLSGVSVLPHPVQQSVPIIVGGRSRAAIRRAAVLGDGWMPYLMSPGRVESGVQELREVASSQGRDPAALRVIAHVFVSFAESPGLGRAKAIEYLSTQYKADLTRSVDSAVAVGPAERCAAFLDRYFAAGATEVVVRPLAHGQDQVATLARYGPPLLEALTGTSFPERPMRPLC